MGALKMKKKADKRIVRIIAILMNVEYNLEYSLSSSRYFVQTGMRKALVAPEKKSVCISSGKLKAMIKASTGRVAPKIYAWTASRTKPMGLLIRVIMEMTEPFFTISVATFLRLYVSDAFCSNIFSLHGLS
jgi:hypothetical protein